MPGQLVSRRITMDGWSTGDTHGSTRGTRVASTNLSYRRRCRRRLIEHSRPVIADLWPGCDVQPVEAVGRDDGDGQIHELLFAEVISRRGVHPVRYVDVGDARHGLR